MKYMVIALSVLIQGYVYGFCTFFAPYGGQFPVSLESRFEGIVAHRPTCHDVIKDVFDWHFKGYIKYYRGFFGKLGTEVVSLKVRDISWDERCIIQRVGVDLQLGKYWYGIGAIRFGMFATGPGIGGDYWLFYNRLKWLTTLEFSGNEIHGWFEHDKFKPMIKWLNRVFIVDGVFVSFGLNHFGDSKRFKRARTQLFLGFGAAV